jgi:hypothetical protein
MSAISLLKKRQIKEFSNEHIPYRIHFVEMGIFACLLILRGEQATPGPLSVAGCTFQHTGKRIFLNMAVESALIYCRVLLNFLGIYKLQKRRMLESRAPQPNFRGSEVWIERFPNGRLLSTTELCRLTSTTMHPRTVRAHIIETLHAASRGVAHLTIPKGGEIKSSKLRVEPLLTTCTVVRHHIREHFYRQTVKAPYPASMDHFDEMYLKYLDIGSGCRQNI